MCVKEKPLLVPTNALFGPEGGDKSATLSLRGLGGGGRGGLRAGLLSRGVLDPAAMKGSALVRRELERS